ncbi:MAG: nucleoside:proton symporter [Alphaproteobacteria bacterium]|nr:nucleoside:proton symporter [Alphaproteobacteria bacterium]
MDFLSLAKLQGLLGVFCIPALAWALSESRRELGARQVLRVVAGGLGLQIAVAVLFLLVPKMSLFFEFFARAVAALQDATMAGVRLVFGYLGGAPAPFEVTRPENGLILGFQALPLILVMSVLSKLLYHWGVLQKVVATFAWVLRRAMGVEGPLGMATAANIFVGMVEAPLLIRPYIAQMGRGALFATMTAGLATVAGTVMAFYAFILSASLPDAAGHILAASVMSAPAALMIARLMVPDGFAGGPVEASLTVETETSSSMDAITQGTVEGLRLLAYVVAMLVVMVALVALVNGVLGLLTPLTGNDLTVQGIVGWLLKPVAWLIGIPWQEAGKAGELIGIKTILNEFLAYLELAKVPADELSARSRLILTYGLCGFANLGSLGIMTGGLIAMAPERRADILALGPKSIVAGTLATLLTGAIVGILTPS